MKIKNFYNQSPEVNEYGQALHNIQRGNPSSSMSYSLRTQKSYLCFSTPEEDENLQIVRFTNSMTVVKKLRRKL